RLQDARDLYLLPGEAAKIDAATAHELVCGRFGGAGAARFGDDEGVLAAARAQAAVDRHRLIERLLGCLRREFRPGRLLSLTCGGPDERGNRDRGGSNRATRHSALLWRLPCRIHAAWCRGRPMPV